MADDLRNQAEGYLRDGVIYIAAAFNLAHSRCWTFDDDVRERALRLLADVKGLFDDSAIRSRSPRLQNFDRPRYTDAAFANFMYVLTVQAKDGSFVGRLTCPPI